ncbi:hypothetical protein ES703_41461 [subsurface metagenome]
MAETLGTLDIIKNRVTDLQPLYDRMDRTKELAYGTPFVLKGFDGKPIEKVINVTTNWPGVFANAIINDLMGGIWQTVIESEGKLSDKQKHIIENFIEDNLSQADEQLINRGKAELFALLANHVCIRSLIGVRWVSQFDKGEYKIDCLPVDMRWTPFEFGNDGMNWVAAKTFRSKAKIQAQYEKELSVAGTSISGTGTMEMTDYWTSEKNEIWLEDKLLKTQKHPFGEPTFVIVIPATGFMLMDKDSIEHEAEDLFFLNRGLYGERSRSMSIEQTLGMDILRPPYEQETEEPGSLADKTPKTGEVKKVKKGEKHILLERET